MSAERIVTTTRNTTTALTHRQARQYSSALISRLSLFRDYEFLSQIVEYEDRELEQLCVFARHLYPLSEVGSGTAHDPEKKLHSEIIEALHARAVPQTR